MYCLSNGTTAKFFKNHCNSSQNRPKIITNMHFSLLYVWDGAFMLISKFCRESKLMGISSEIIAKPSENYIIIKQAKIHVVRLWRKISKSSRESENHLQIIGSHCKIIQKLLLATSNPAYCMFQRDHRPASHRGSRKIIALTLVRACCHMLLLEDTNKPNMKTCKL